MTSNVIDKPAEANEDFHDMKTHDDDCYHDDICSQKESDGQHLNGDGMERKSSLGRYFWILVFIACTLLVVRIWDKNTTAKGEKSGAGVSPNGISVMPSTPDNTDVEELRRKRAEELLQLEKEKLKADINVRYAKYKGDVTAIAEKYRKMLPLCEAEFQFKKAEEGVAFMASKNGLCGFKVSATLAYKIAYDKVKHTNFTEQAIQPIVSTYLIDPITKAINTYSKWTSDFRRELQAEDQALSLDLAMRSHKFTDSILILNAPAATNLGTSVCRLVDDIREHAKESVCAGVGAALEVAFARSSYTAIRKLISGILKTALGSIAKKMTVTVAAAATSAAADGPLPICDIGGVVITIGGAVWTAYEIYRVTESMPEELKDHALGSLRDARKSLLDAATKNLESESEECLKSAETRVAEIYKLLN